MQDKNPATSPFEMVTSPKPKKVNKKTIFIGVGVIIFLILSVVAGVLLVRQQQTIQEKAAASLCPAAAACPVPGQPDTLKSCDPGNADGTPEVSSCSNVDLVGTISACGTQQFCCPSLGASWTTDLTLCQATPSPTATANAAASASASGATASASATPTATATASATPLVQTTPRAIPVTGTDWPTVLGAGVGVTAIIGAILLAL